MPISVHFLSMSSDKNLTERDSTEVWLRPPLLPSSGGQLSWARGGASRYQNSGGLGGERNPRNHGISTWNALSRTKQKHITHLGWNNKGSGCWAVVDHHLPQLLSILPIKLKYFRVFISLILLGEVLLTGPWEPMCIWSEKMWDCIDFFERVQPLLYGLLKSTEWVTLLWYSDGAGAGRWAMPASRGLQLQKLKIPSLVHPKPSEQTDTLCGTKMRGRLSFRSHL